MTRVRAWLVDDEQLALDRLEDLLATTGRVDIVGRSTDPEAALAGIEQAAPDLLFLDIQMPGLTGFDLLGRLRRQPLVIFTTAYDEFALRAFEVNSVDYLLKPVDPVQLERALDKLQRLREGAAQPDVRALLEQVTRSLRTPQREYPRRIASRMGERVVFLDLARVTHFYAQDKLTYAASQGKSWCVDHTIADLEQHLDPNRFIRIHRATLLNADWVRDVSPLFNGSLAVRLRDEGGTELTVARDRAREFREKLGW